MKKILILSLILISVVISFILKSKTNFILEEPKEKITNEETKENTKKEIIVNLKYDDKSYKLNLEKYVIGVVACEMPASYDIEALKAQAIAVRTFVLRKLNKKNMTIKATKNDQCYHTISQMKKKWGKNYSKYYNKIRKSVKSTTNKYISYNGEIITSFYFSNTNGYTENSENVFVKSEPYLKSVASFWDKDKNDFEYVTYFSEKEFLEKLNLKESKIENIKILSRYESNRVKYIKVNNTKFKGTEFRKLLGIRSTDFDIELKDNVIITTKGYGHGVGMSQYGANQMALNGYNYEEIIKYYYKDVTISEYK